MHVWSPETLGNDHLGIGKTPDLPGRSIQMTRRALCLQSNTTPRGFCEQLAVMAMIRLGCSTANCSKRARSYHEPVFFASQSCLGTPTDQEIRANDRQGKPQVWRKGADHGVENLMKFCLYLIFCINLSLRDPNQGFFITLVGFLWTLLDWIPLVWDLWFGFLWFGVFITLVGLLWTLLDWITYVSYTHITLPTTPYVQI